MEDNTDKILELHAEGYGNKAIAELISTEDNPVSYQSIGKILRDNMPDVATTPKVIATADVVGVTTMTTSEYGDYSEKCGRTRYGGEKGVKLNATIEELRAYINSGWKPNMLLEKWQFTEEDLIQLTWKLAKAELRDRQPTVNFKQDFFRF